jgi:putative polyhydroxyalkanoate system protein
MSKPLVVDIPHQYTRQEAKSRIQNGIGEIRSQVAAFASSIEDHWNGDEMEFRVVAVGQTVTGRIEVLDQSVHVEVNLPWVLSMVAQKLRGRIERQGSLLLEKSDRGRERHSD